MKINRTVPFIFDGEKAYMTVMRNMMSSMPLVMNAKKRTLIRIVQAVFGSEKQA
jgi:hypothetical protein